MFGGIHNKIYHLHLVLDSRMMNQCLRLNAQAMCRKTPFVQIYNRKIGNGLKHRV